MAYIPLRVAAPKGAALSMSADLSPKFFAFKIREFPK